MFPIYQRGFYYENLSKLFIPSVCCSIPITHSWCVPTGFAIYTILAKMQSHGVRFALEIAAGSALPTHLLKYMAKIHSSEIEFVATDPKLETHNEYHEYEDVKEMDAISSVNHYMNIFEEQGVIAIYCSWLREEFALEFLDHIVLQYGHLKIVLCIFTEDACEGKEFDKNLIKYGFDQEHLSPRRSAIQLRYAFSFTYLKLCTREPGIHIDEA